MWEITTDAPYRSGTFTQHTQQMHDKHIRTHAPHSTYNAHINTSRERGKEREREGENGKERGKMEKIGKRWDESESEGEYNSTLNYCLLYFCRETLVRVER